MDDVVAEVRSLVANGVREINLISQDTTFYGKDLVAGAPVAAQHAVPMQWQQPSLASLLLAIQRIDGDFWVRLLYTHPAHWTDELIDTIAECSKVCRYVDIPLQHINDRMLDRMRRETDGRYIRRLLRNIRAGIPGVALRTTFIVGFPGETEKEFKELLAFIEQTKFERLGILTYSREDHTVAGNMRGQVSAKVKKQRYDRAMALQQKVSREIHEQLIGKTIRVLVEAREGDKFVGRSHADAPEIDGTVKFSGQAAVGAFADVRITGASEYDLTGETLPDAGVSNCG